MKRCACARDSCRAGYSHLVLGPEHSRESCPRSRIYPLNQYSSALRMDEFKTRITVELQEAIFQRGFTGGFNGSIVTHSLLRLFCRLRVKSSFVIMISLLDGPTTQT